ncbi:hypothetical protein CRG98_034524 [Punica granatum]|uniref:Uncharacterized protein n=1 Tax=Punica granatum TaxID=22663 RepID=A0A2I0IN76_PUNGR|nr:hypothetical protein CRG98_034524 [Punica granatum]
MVAQLRRINPAGSSEFCWRVGGFSHRRSLIRLVQVGNRFAAPLTGRLRRFEIPLLRAHIESRLASTESEAGGEKVPRFTEPLPRLCADLSSAYLVSSWYLRH